MTMKPEYEKLHLALKDSPALRALLERDYTIMGLARHQPQVLDDMIANIRKLANNPNLPMVGDTFGWDFKELAQEYPECFKEWLAVAALDGRNADLTAEMLINFISGSKPIHRNRKPTRQERNEQIVQSVFLLNDPHSWNELYPRWARSLLQEAASAIAPDGNEQATEPAPTDTPAADENTKLSPAPLLTKNGPPNDGNKAGGFGKLSGDK
ncbi:hypothetical protein [Conchiformibius steedae]|uniref:hypothetical protein n=1 Tax=Conchiformibius steedae TaxID=153493 RepID=UPI0026EB0030|nr:hypothetical protein [Conchiformibius steedae]